MYYTSFLGSRGLFDTLLLGGLVAGGGGLGNRNVGGVDGVNELFRVRVSDGNEHALLGEVPDGFACD